MGDQGIAQSWVHVGLVNGCNFSRDESRVLTWSYDGTARLWRASDPLAALSPKERICELEFRTGMTLDENQNLRTLSFDEWQGRLKSEEYREITKKFGDHFPVSGIPLQQTIEHVKSEPTDGTSTKTNETSPQSQPDATSEDRSTVEKSARIHKPRSVSSVPSLNYFTLLTSVGLLALIVLLVLAFDSANRRQQSNRRDR